MIVWEPKHPKKTRMWQFIQFINDQHQQAITDYHQLHQWTNTYPQRFWPALCDFFSIAFDTPAQEILNKHQHPIDARWFSGAMFNFAQKLLSRRDNHPALISIMENGERDVITYEQLFKRVACCARGLQEAGVGIGDRVAAVMPNVSQTIIAMLATTSLGAIWASCSSDFGAQAAIDRLEQIEPKVLFIANGHPYQGKIHRAKDKITALQAAMPSVQQWVICPIIDDDIDINDIPKAVSWDNFLLPAESCEFVSLPFDHPVYILFSSGTTGKPKCIIHGAGGTLLQHIKELGLHCNLGYNDNLCFYTTCGWMMWNWMVSVLALGSTLTLYEGSPAWPDTYRLFELIEQEKITAFGTSAKFIASVEKSGAKPAERFEMKALKSIFSTGSPLLPQHYDFVYQHVKADLQLSSISGGTDIVSCFALGNPILPVYRGELQCLGLGMAVNVFSELGKPVISERGELVCTQAFPSMPVGFWNDPYKKAYHHAYFERFPGVWTHGDFAEITTHGGIIIYGRSDTVLNPAGVRIGTAEIYRQVEKVPEVLEAVVIGQDWDHDQRVVLFVKLREGVTLDETLRTTIRQTIRQHASPRHVPAVILQVNDIPRTINGKIVEMAVRQIVHNQPIQNMQSIANPEALEYFKHRDELMM